jgi:hypothetical protein
MEEARLIKMKEKIETMSKIQHIEILKILKNFKQVKINENKNGVYVNLSFLKKEIVEEIEKYVYYIEEQNKILY